MTLQFNNKKFGGLKMKKLLGIVFSILFFCSASAFADEVTPAQSAKNNQTYFTANIQKQPQNSKQKQAISNHFTFFTINIQVNGKIDDLKREKDVQMD